MYVVCDRIVAYTHLQIFNIGDFPKRLSALNQVDRTVNCRESPVGLV